jgi:Asp-tRNA(Asn)/Glu-tRNA(Gln) amidotransferase A subunit family amidase
MTVIDFKQQSIGELHALIQQYRITPGDIALHCIETVLKREGDAKAWAAFDGEKLIEASRASARRLCAGEPLRGLEAIPVGVKDIFNTADFATQMGSALWAGFTPGNDARAVFNLKRAGGLVPGKTGTAEFAVHTLGATRNPWDASRTPGTSSSGSAVAVALGMVPAALGTQTAGSIVRPASFCGVWGMKPSFGLIPRTGMLKTTDSLDTVGFFTQHAQDLSRLFDGLRVHGRDYPISSAALGDTARQATPTARPWRVAFVKPHVWRHAPAYATGAMQAWINQLADDPRFEVFEPALPDEMAECHPVHATIYNRALAYYFKAEFEKRELVSPTMNALIEAGLGVTPAAYESALERQTQLARTMERWFQATGADVVLTLSTAGTAPLRHVEEQPDAALMWTLTHLPAASAPAFFSPRGLPFGLQIAARRYNDPLLMNFIDEAVARGHLPAASPRVVSAGATPGAAQPATDPAQAELAAS